MLLHTLVELNVWEHLVIRSKHHSEVSINIVVKKILNKKEAGEWLQWLPCYDHKIQSDKRKQITSEGCTIFVEEFERMMTCWRGFNRYGIAHVLQSRITLSIVDYLFSHHCSCCGCSECFWFETTFVTKTRTCLTHTV